jgi:hypothetical protein
MHDASPVAYANVFDAGDRLERRQSCLGCGPSCCPGDCGMLVEGRCLAHAYGNGQGSAKPLGCCLLPGPVGQDSNCSLVWEIVAGPNAGKFRWKCDPNGTYRTEGPS